MYFILKRYNVVVSFTIVVLITIFYFGTICVVNRVKVKKIYSPYLTSMFINTFLFNARLLLGTSSTTADVSLGAGYDCMRIDDVPDKFRGIHGGNLREPLYADICKFM